jgi:hypothetical protein
VVRARAILQEKLTRTQADLEFAAAEVRRRAHDVLWASPEARRLLEDLLVATKTRARLYAAVEALGVPPSDLVKFTVTNPTSKQTWRRLGPWRRRVWRLMRASNSRTVEPPAVILL